MISEGQIVLFRFPQTDQQSGKFRPALVVRKLPGRYEDLLVCMISSQLNDVRLKRIRHKLSQWLQST